jgi:hypothetical protein
MKIVYLDNNATSMVAPEVVKLFDLSSPSGTEIHPACTRLVGVLPAK